MTVNLHLKTSLQFILMFSILSIAFSCQEKDDIKSKAEDEFETSIIKYGVSKETLLNSNSFNIVSSKLQNRQSGKTLNKHKSTITDLTAEQLMERLNLETTYFHSENGIEVLNAPVRTFGNYKRAILSLTKNNITNSYILTYPDPDNIKLFYVSNLDDILLQKVTIGDDGIGVIDNYKSPLDAASKPSQNYALRTGSCTETVYQKCSSGNHSFNSGNAMECTYWHNLSAGTPPQVFQVPTECGDSGDSNGDGQYGDGGGGGSGGYNTPPSGNAGPPINLSPIECIVNLDCEDCGLPGDLNGDCTITYDEGRFNLFLQNLNGLQLSTFNNLNENSKTDVLNYLIANDFSERAKSFATYAIHILNNNSEANPFIGADCRSFEYSFPPGALQRGCAVEDFNHTFYTVGVRPNGSPYYGEIDSIIPIIYFTAPTSMTNGRSANLTAVAVTFAIQATDIHYGANPDISATMLGYFFRDALIAEMAAFGGSVSTTKEPFPISKPAQYITSLIGLGNPYNCE